MAEKVLKEHPDTESEFVFPEEGGQLRKNHLAP